MSRIPSNGGSVNSSVTRHATAMPCAAGHRSQYAETSMEKYLAIKPGNAAATATPKTTPITPPPKPSISVCAV